MTIIFGDAKKWIEVHFVNMGFVANGTGNNSAFNLDKPGRVIGVSDVLSLENATPTASITHQVVKGDLTAIDTYGEMQSTLTCRFRNDSGIGLTVTVIVMVYMRG